MGFKINDNFKMEIICWFWVKIISRKKTRKSWWQNDKVGFQSNVYPKRRRLLKVRFRLRIRVLNPTHNEPSSEPIWSDAEPAHGRSGLIPKDYESSSLLRLTTNKLEYTHIFLPNLRRPRWCFHCQDNLHGTSKPPRELSIPVSNLRRALKNDWDFHMGKFILTAIQFKVPRRRISASSSSSSSIHDSFGGREAKVGCELVNFRKTCHQIVGGILDVILLKTASSSRSNLTKYKDRREKSSLACLFWTARNQESFLS